MDIFTSSPDWPLLLGVMKADLHHLTEYNEVIFIGHRPAELLIFARLLPLVDLPLQHDRYVIGVMLPEWLAWNHWIVGITEPEEELELEGNLCTSFSRHFLLSNLIRINFKGGNDYLDSINRWDIYVCLFAMLACVRKS